MRRRCCCSSDFISECGNSIGQPYRDWLIAHGWDGTQGDAILTISGSTCPGAGNNGTHNLPPNPASPQNDDYRKTGGSGGPGCGTNVQLDIILACDAISSIIQISGYYAGNGPVCFKNFPFPVNASDIFGATHTLTDLYGGFHGIWTVTLPS